jgi:hypothetical protein
MWKDQHGMQFYANFEHPLGGSWHRDPLRGVSSSTVGENNFDLKNEKTLKILDPLSQGPNQEPRIYNTHEKSDIQSSSIFWTLPLHLGGENLPLLIELQVRIVHKLFLQKRSNSVLRAMHDKKRIFFHFKRYNVAIRVVNFCQTFCTCSPSSGKIL